MKRFFLPGLLIAMLSASCMHSSNAMDGTALLLASFTENDVSVSIQLDSDTQGKSVLSATFTPPQGYHLYSKDIPYNGLDGLGRPTLIELSPGSLMKATDILFESVKAQASDFEPKELLVYPLGAVTLSLPVELPPGNSWVEDEVEVTYMACSASLCKPPVVAKRVLVRIPGGDMLERK